jgi:hypothetical protein
VDGVFGCATVGDLEGRRWKDAAGHTTGPASIRLPQANPTNELPSLNRGN